MPGEADPALSRARPSRELRGAGRPRLRRLHFRPRAARHLSLAPQPLALGPGLDLGHLARSTTSASPRPAPTSLTYAGAPLTAPLRLAGTPLVHLVASTSGTDSDWIVKLIDVYPDPIRKSAQLGGYRLAIAMDVMRGRYRDDPRAPDAGAAPTSR